MQSAGLGGMQINTVVIPWTHGAGNLHSNRLDSQTPLDFVGLLADGVLLKRNVVVARHADQLDRRLFTSKAVADDDKSTLTQSSGKQTIDVWVTSDWGDVTVDASAALMLQLAYVLYSNPRWRARTSLRLLKLSASSDAGALQRERKHLERLAEKLRVDSHVTDLVVVPAYSSSASLSVAPTSIDVLQDPQQANLALQRHSRHSAQVLLPLPDPRPFACDEAGAAAFVARLAQLTDALPSTLLVSLDDDAPSVISTGI
jgi:hypothetical protein